MSGFGEKLSFFLQLKERKVNEANAQYTQLLRFVDGIRGAQTIQEADMFRSSFEAAFGPVMNNAFLGDAQRRVLDVARKAIGPLYAGRADIIAHTEHMRRGEAAMREQLNEQRANNLSVARGERLWASPQFAEISTVLSTFGDDYQKQLLAGKKPSFKEKGAFLRVMESAIDGVEGLDDKQRDDAKDYGYLAFKALTDGIEGKVRNMQLSGSYNGMTAATMRAIKVAMNGDRAESQRLVAEMAKAQPEPDVGAAVEKIAASMRRAINPGTSSGVIVATDAAKELALITEGIMTDKVVTPLQKIGVTEVLDVAMNAGNKEKAAASAFRYAGLVYGLSRANPDPGQAMPTVSFLGTDEAKAQKALEFATAVREQILTARGDPNSVRPSVQRVSREETKKRLGDTRSLLDAFGMKASDIQELIENNGRTARGKGYTRAFDEFLRGVVDSTKVVGSAGKLVGEDRDAAASFFRSVVPGDTRDLLFTADGDFDAIRLSLDGAFGLAAKTYSMDRRAEALFDASVEATKAGPTVAKAVREKGTLGFLRSLSTYEPTSDPFAIEWLRDFVDDSIKERTTFGQALGAKPEMGTTNPLVVGRIQ